MIYGTKPANFFPFFIKKNHFWIDSGVIKKYDDLDCYSHFAIGMNFTYKHLKGFSLKKIKQEKIYYFDGACYYISNLSLTWDSSLSLCQEMGRNNYSSLYEYYNYKELSFLKNRIGEFFINDSRLVKSKSKYAIEPKISIAIGLHIRKNSTCKSEFYF